MKPTKKKTNLRGVVLKKLDYAYAWIEDTPQLIAKFEAMGFRRVKKGEPNDSH